MPSVSTADTLSARKNFSNSRGRAASGTPMPVSVTAHSTSAPSLVISTAMRPPRGVYLIAFETRFCSTCRSSWASPMTACPAPSPVAVSW